jgi:hypothetical protein
MLASRLKAVYYLEPSAPNLAVEGSSKVAPILQYSECLLPGRANGALEARPQPERFRQVSAREFLEAMAGCFQ